MAYSLKKEILLHAPIQKVWTTYRDHLPTLAEVMPTVESITVINRKETIKEVYLENIWKLSAGIPFAIRKIIPEKLLSYRDQATWKEELWVCDFIETPVDGSNIYICKGPAERISWAKTFGMGTSPSVNKEDYPPYDEV